MFQPQGTAVISFRWRRHTVLVHPSKGSQDNILPVSGKKKVCFLQQKVFCLHYPGYTQAPQLLHRKILSQEADCNPQSQENHQVSETIFLAFSAMTRFASENFFYQGF